MPTSTGTSARSRSARSTSRTSTPASSSTPASTTSGSSREAEQEADVILWDGGNNDLPFYVPDLHVVLADPLRPGDEAAYHPGEANVRMADVVVIAKCDSARTADIEAVEASVRALNPRADRAARRQPGHRRRPDRGRRTPRHRRRGRPDPDPRLDDLRRRRRRRPRGRRGRDRRPDAVRRGVDRRDLREVPERARHPAGHGLRRGAGARPRGDDPRGGRGGRLRRRRDAARPSTSPGC